MRLKLTGDDRFSGNGVLCPWRGTDCRPPTLRRRASRPQLKRDPLGSTTLMLPSEAEPELLNRFTAAGLAPGALDPWEAWKVVKQYLHSEVHGVYDAASFQCGQFPDDGGEGESFYATFARQFSKWEGKEDAPIRRVVVEVRYGLDQIRPGAPAEGWRTILPHWRDLRAWARGC